MASKFLYITDLHLKAKTPQQRKDNDVFLTISHKLDYLVKYIQDESIDCVVIGGDIGHVCEWKVKFALKVSNLFKKFNCPVFTIVGNHDVPGRRFQEYEDFNIGFLERSGVLKVLPLEGLQFKDFIFYGFHSDTDETYKLVLNGEYPQALDPNFVNVAVVHAPVGPETNIIAGIKGWQELKIKDFDFALFGDIHQGFPTSRLKSGTVVANPGTLFRQRIDEADLEPSALIISSDRKIKRLIIPHKSKSQVFQLQESTDKIGKEAGKQFINALRAKLNNKDISPIDKIKEFGEALEVPQESIETLIWEVKNGKREK